jgi:hypothetical protein
VKLTEAPGTRVGDASVLASTGCAITDKTTPVTKVIADNAYSVYAILLIALLMGVFTSGSPLRLNAYL